jgi:hypothetical protein
MCCTRQLPQNVHREKKSVMRFKHFNSGVLVMLDSCSKYLSLVLARRLDTEAQRWFSTLESGFDVAIVTPEPALQAAVKTYLENTPRQFKKIKFKAVLLGSPMEREHAGVSDSVDVHPADPNRQTDRTLTLTAHRPPAGTGAIPFYLPTLEEFLPSPSTMTGQFLELSGLERYTEAFDGRKMTLLRKILELRGPEVFFDAIVQVAFLAGYRGEDEAAFDFLNQLHSEAGQKPPEKRRNLGAEGGRAPAPTSDMCALFDRLVELQEPHDVLKAALAHYVFHARKLTQTEASRILKVSRSTLQAHLQLAERLNVAEFFV